MSNKHPEKLINRIINEIKNDYDPSEYEFVIEESLLNTRMVPDIQVFKGSQLVCVIEIGYTRPEKLERYRTEFKIPDIRWYSKDGKLLDLKEKERIVIKKNRLPASDEQKIRSALGRMNAMQSKVNVTEKQPLQMPNVMEGKFFIISNDLNVLRVVLETLNTRGSKWHEDDPRLDTNMIKS